MKYQDYHQNRVDEILDKINKMGINSLTKIEKDYLDAFGENDETKMINLDYEFRLRDFKSIDGYFHYTLSRIEYFVGEGDFYYGEITVPDLEFGENKRIEGNMEGYILVTSNNDKIPFFEKEGYDILEFCNGLEYELDNFLDYVIDTLNDEKNSF